MAKKKTNYSGGNFTPRKPDFELSVFDKATQERAKVGVAWINEKGHISIRLNLCTVLHARDGLLITLFPTDQEEKPEETKEEKSRPPIPLAPLTATAPF